MGMWLNWSTSAFKSAQSISPILELDSHEVCSILARPAKTVEWFREKFWKMSVILSVIAMAYVLLGLVLLMLSRVAPVMERKEGEKRFDALGREY